MTLLTETNTVEVERKVMALAANQLTGVHHHLDVTFEHGQWWVLCKDCGSSWSVVDCEPGELDLEKIDGGDGYCLLSQSGKRRRANV